MINIKEIKFIKSLIKRANQIVDEYKNNGNIVLKDDIDDDLNYYLYKLYKPFLSNIHFTDKYKKTIYDRATDTPIGTISLADKNRTFMQIAMIPELRNKGLANEAIDEFIKQYGIDKVMWTASKSNYPSMKLLYNKGGGIFDDNPDRETYEGFYRTSGKMGKQMRQNLENILEESKKKYSEWKDNVYSKRLKEMEDLRMYLESQKNAVDASK